MIEIDSWESINLCYMLVLIYLTVKVNFPEINIENIIVTDLLWFDFKFSTALHF